MSNISQVLKKLAPNPSLAAYVTKQATTLNIFKDIVIVTIDVQRQAK